MTGWLNIPTWLKIPTWTWMVLCLDGSLSIAAKKYNCSTLKLCFCCHAKNISSPVDLKISKLISYDRPGTWIGIPSKDCYSMYKYTCMSRYICTRYECMNDLVRHVYNYSISACPNTWTAWPISASMLASGAFDLVESSCLQTYGETNLRANALHRKNSWKRSRNFYKIREIFQLCSLCLFYQHASQILKKTPCSYSNPFRRVFLAPPMVTAKPPKRSKKPGALIGKLQIILE